MQQAPSAILCQVPVVGVKERLAGIVSGAKKENEEQRISGTPHVTLYLVSGSRISGTPLDLVRHNEPLHRN